MSEELPSSKLGTIQHWNDVYKRELAEYNDTGDEGEIWFGEQTQKKLVKWLENCVEVNENSEIIDIGCGNGMLLIEMAKDGFVKLTGCDYAPLALELARKIAKREKTLINFLEVDILNMENSPLQGKYFDVCIDKGTYDAISLTPNQARHCREKYKGAVCGLLKENGIFALASCNWTIHELLDFFGTDFLLCKDLPSPKFAFGGKTGQAVTSSIWRKKPCK